MNTPPPPPAGRWLRLSEAAARIGLPPRVLKSCLSAGTTGIRSRLLGRRGLTYLAESDLPQFAERLNQAEAPL